MSCVNYGELRSRWRCSHVGAAFKAIVAGFLCFLMAGCGGADSSEEAKKDKDEKAKEKPILVEIHEVQRGVIEVLLERSAALQAERQVQVLARTENPAIELLVEEGDSVLKDQILLKLESDRQRTEYEQSKSQLDKAALEFQRTEKLYQQNLVSESEYANNQFAFQQAQLLCEQAKRELDYTEVRAPIGGVITQREVKVGDRVTTGTPIFEIVDLASTVAVIHVPEQYLPKLKQGMVARLSSDTIGDQLFEGFVSRISPVVDADAGTVKVVVGLSDLGQLAPGMWVKVELVLDRKESAVLIPKRAVTYNVDRASVFKAIMDDKGVIRAQRQPLETLNVDKRHIEPAGGFEEGDWIVVAGQAGLKDQVALRQAETEDAPDTSMDPAPVQQ